MFGRVLVAHFEQANFALGMQDELARLIGPGMTISGGRAGAGRHTRSCSRSAAVGVVASVFGIAT